MEHMYRILKGLPLPEDGRFTYPFPSMEVGDCFEFHSEEADRVGSAACRWARNHPEFKFSVRKIRTKQGVHAVWRVPVNKGEMP